MVGSASLGNDNKICRPLLELDNHDAVFYFAFGGRSQMVFELDHLC